MIFNNRKKSISGFVLIITLMLCLNSFATKRYWVGTGANKSWKSTANWSATSGGASGASIPVAADSVYFNGSGTGQCLIDTAVSVKRFDIAAGYTDTIKQNTYVITVGTSGMILSGGKFWGGSAAINNQGVFTLSGTYFKSSSGRLTIQKDYTFTSGTFAHNNGEVLLTGVFNINGSTTFYKCIFYPLSGVGGTFTLGSTTQLTVEDLLTYTNAVVNGGAINAKGDITSNGTSVGYSSSTTINIVGTGNQNINGHTNPALIAHGWLPNIKINKSSGILYLKDLIIVKGKWEFVAGTIDATTYNSTIGFPAGLSNRIIGKQALNNVNIGTSGGSVDTMIVNSNDTLTILGNLTTSGNGATAITGYVNLKGNLVIGNLSTNNAGGGAGIININGTGSQTIDGSSGVNIGRLCSVKINKPSGILYLKDTIPVDGDWIYLQGTVDYTTYNSNVSFNTSSTGRIISGNQSFNNVTFYASAACYINTPTNDTLKVNGTLVYQGSSLVKIESGVVSAKGDITISSSYNAINSTGVGTLLINGSGNQTLTGRATLGEGRVSNVKISKSGGTLYLKNIFSVQGNWTYVQGTIDATTYNATVAFVTNVTNNVTRTISGNHTLNNVSIDAITYSSLNTISTNDTLTVLGLLTLSGGGALQINTGTINLKGDLTITNSNTTVVGTGLINLCGTTNQTIQGRPTALQGKLCNVSINKASGTVILKEIISLADGAGWKLINGTLDATTYASTVVFTRGTKSIEGNQTFYNLHFNSPGGNGVNNINASDTLTVNGELKIIGSHTATLNSGLINALGDVTVTNTSLTNAGSAVINICGTGDQSLTGCGVAGSGDLCKIKIDKASGTLNLKSIITLGESFTYVKGFVNPNNSIVVNDISSNISCGTTMSSAMPFYDFVVRTGTTTLTGVLKLNGTLTINASRTFNANGKAISIGQNWNNSGTFTYANSTVSFTGTSSQYLMKSSGTETFHILRINKAGKLYLTKPISVENTLELTNGVVVTTTTNILNIPDNGKCDPGNDSSYVAGPFKKTGNDAFVFSLGDTTLVSGAYHPLAISAPGVTTDVFTAQFYATGQTYGSGLQTDSLVSISNCEYWTLIRNVGSSVVIPSLGWNINACDYNNGYLRPAAWNGTIWTSIGTSQYVENVSLGTLASTAGYSAATLPLVIGKNAQLQVTGIVTDFNCSTSAPGSINLSPTGGTAPYTYFWSNGSTSQNQTGLSEGVYSVTVTDNASHVFNKQFRVYRCSEWTDLTGVSFASDALTKTTTDGWYNATAKSKNLLYETSTGAVKYKVEDASRSFGLGFSEEGKSDSTLANTKFAFLMDGGFVEVYVNGAYVSYTYIQKNDVLELLRSESALSLIKNGKTISTTALTNQNALKLDFLPYKQSVSISGIKATFGRPKFVLNTQLIKDTLLGNDSTDIEVLLDSTFVSNTKTGELLPLALPVAFASNATYDIKFTKSTLADTKLKCVTTKYGAVQSLTIFNDTTFVPLDSLFYFVKNKRELTLVPLNSSPEVLNPSIIYLNLEGGIVLSPNGDSNYDYLTLHGKETVSAFQLDVYDLNDNLIYTTTDKNFSWDGKDIDTVLVKGTYKYLMVVDGDSTAGSFLIDF